MSHKLKIISYALIILFVLVVPSQADAQCYTPEACKDLALEMGLGTFKGSGSYQTKGCYAISPGHPDQVPGDVWFGTGGSQAQMDQQPTVSPYQYRLCGPNAASQAAEAQAAAPIPPNTGEEYNRCVDKEMGFLQGDVIAAQEACGCRWKFRDRTDCSRGELYYYTETGEWIDR